MKPCLLSWLVWPLLVAGTACTQFPALDRTITPGLEAAPYPELQPLESLLRVAQSSDTDPALTEARLKARVSALRARASRMRGGVLSGRERQRLGEGLK